MEKLKIFAAKHKEVATEDRVRLILRGIASHHAGMLPVWKSLVEGLYQEGLIKVSIYIHMHTHTHTHTHTQTTHTRTHTNTHTHTLSLSHTHTHIHTHTHTQGGVRHRDLGGGYQHACKDYGDHGPLEAKLRRRRKFNLERAPTDVWAGGAPRKRHHRTLSDDALPVGGRARGVHAGAAGSRCAHVQICPELCYGVCVGE
jgi:hypothetical protein